MTDQPTAGRRLLGGLREVLLIVVGALVISAVLRAFVFEPFTIPSGSMENTLQVNDKVIAQKVTDFRRGDVIVFRDPGEWINGTTQPRTNPAARLLEFVGVLPNSSDDFLTKRVIGLPGDRVSCCGDDGRLTINGQPLDETAYLFTDPIGQINPSDIEFDVIVPQASLFVLGDHRNASADSRCHLTDQQPGSEPGATAFVPVDHVVGPVGMIVAPFDRWQQLKTPAAFDEIPAGAGEAPATARIMVPADC